MKISIYLALSLASIAFIAGLSFGYYLTPEYRLTMYDKNNMDLGPADRSFDRRYLNAMISHHRGAMILAEQAQTLTDRQEITALTQAILSEEPKAIDELYAWKNEWYQDKRSVRDPQVDNLGTKDNNSDLRFLNALISHHQAGIIMAQEAKQKSQRSTVLDNADAVIDFLTNSKEQLESWRQEWYSL